MRASVCWSGVELRVDGVGGFGDRAAHAARFGVAAQRERAPATAFPRLQQRVGEQRQRARFRRMRAVRADVAQHQIHQPWFEDPTLTFRRFFDGVAQIDRSSLGRCRPGGGSGRRADWDMWRSGRRSRRAG